MTIGKPQSGAPGTTEHSPRWEGPEATRPRGYLPAKDDPDRDRDAHGENNADPSREKLSDAGKTRDDPPEDAAETEEERIERKQATNPALMPIGDPSGAA
ncbi:hypothetical protein GCM10023069_45410 [Shinella granuli]|uniref:Uncharacterized protein n=1 Tax=Shinella granuli TaxID=323621 RepID=A0A4R2D494_SHIGR|nr:hypothetical protein EV665_101240 [Shinella granuli]